LQSRYIAVIASNKTLAKAPATRRMSQSNRSCAIEISPLDDDGDQAPQVGARDEMTAEAFHRAGSQASRQLPDFAAAETDILQQGVVQGEELSLHPFLAPFLGEGVNAILSDAARCVLER